MGPRRESASCVQLKVYLFSQVFGPVARRQPEAPGEEAARVPSWDTVHRLMPPRPHVLVVCTGNAARSVMAGALLDSCGVDARVTTAGTHVVEHQPMSRRTRDALRAIGVEAPEHRSRQIAESDVDSADLVIAMAADHVRYVRRRHPEAADRTATLCWVAEHLPAGGGSLRERVLALDLSQVDPEVQGDVTDPAGGDEVDYLECARTIKVLVEGLSDRLA